MKEWSPDILLDFLKALNKAIESNTDPFVFEGVEYDIGFSRYLAEFLKAQFIREQ